MLVGQLKNWLKMLLKESWFWNGGSWRPIAPGSSWQGSMARSISTLLRLFGLLTTVQRIIQAKKEFKEWSWLGNTSTITTLNAIYAKNSSLHTSLESMRLTTCVVTGKSAHIRSSKLLANTFALFALSSMLVWVTFRRTWAKTGLMISSLHSAMTLANLEVRRQRL